MCLESLATSAPVRASSDVVRATIQRVGQQIIVADTTRPGRIGSPNGSEAHRHRAPFVDGESNLFAIEDASVESGRDKTSRIV